MTKAFLQKYPHLSTISPERFPGHIFIIPDGNGRWAKKNNTFVTTGHKKGFEVLYKILDILHEIEYIHTVTIWGFSSDNWKRSEKEVGGLMLLFEQVIKNTLHTLQKQNGRFVHIGRKDRIPSSLRKTIERAERETQNNTGQKVCIAIDFSGEDQEVRIVEKAVEEKLLPPFTEESVWRLRDSAGLIRHADLIIRTSGEKRLSDVGWLNGSPTELYFLSKLLPDITPDDIVEALIDFSKRERRMGARI